MASTRSVGEPAPDARERVVHAQHEGAVLGVRTGKELGGVSAGEGADEHGRPSVGGPERGSQADGMDPD